MYSNLGIQELLVQAAQEGYVRQDKKRIIETYLSRKGCIE